LNLFGIVNKLTGPTLIILFLTLFSSARAHSPHDAIYSFAISPEFDSDGTMMCSTNHLSVYLLKSSNKGVTWTPCQKGLQLKGWEIGDNDRVSTIAYSPFFSVDRTIFSGTVGGILLRSTNNGHAWNNADTGLPGSAVTCIAVSPDFANDHLVFVGIENSGVYLSSDCGDSWVPSISGLGDVNVNDICISPAFNFDRTVFVAGPGGVSKSTDRGLSWTHSSVGLSGSPIMVLGISPEFEAVGEIFAGSYGDGIFHSSDGGLNWSASNSGITDLFVTALAVSPDYPTDHKVWLASRNIGVFQSQDSGSSWMLFDEGLDARTHQAGDIHFRKIIVSPEFSNDQLIFVSMFEGLFASTDGGMNWREADVLSPRYAISLDVSGKYESDGTLFYGTYGGGVYRSQDEGETWKPVNDSLPGRFNYSVSYASPNNHGVYSIGTSTVFHNGRLFYSVNDGNKWGDSVIEPSAAVYKPTVINECPGFPHAKKTLFVGNRADGTFPLYKSSDGGLSFSSIAPGFQGTYAIAYSPRYLTNETVYVGVGGKGAIDRVYKSTDDGASWSSIGLCSLSGVTALAVVVDQVIYAATFGDGVFRTTDGGTSWKKITNTLDENRFTKLVLSPDYQYDYTIFIASVGGGLFKSTNNGKTWQYSGFAGNVVSDIAMPQSFTNDGTLFVSTWDGIYKSNDYGNNWLPTSDIVRYENDCDNLVETGQWETIVFNDLSCHNSFYSQDPGSAIMLPFWGREVSWIGTKGPNHGVAGVYIDSQKVGSVDLYASKYSTSEVLFSHTFSSTGYHEILVAVTSNPNPNSNGNYITVDAFDVIFR